MRTVMFVSCTHRIECLQPCTIGTSCRSIRFYSEEEKNWLSSCFKTSILSLGESAISSMGAIMIPPRPFKKRE